MQPGIDQGTEGFDDLCRQRLRRLCSVMRRCEVAWLLTADPINIAYATGVQNMTIFSMMGASRFALISSDGTVTAWEYAGSEHLVGASRLVGDVRTAPGLTPVSGVTYVDQIAGFANEVADICGVTSASRAQLAVERFDHPVTDGLRDAGFELTSATEVFVESRAMKTPAEISTMRRAMNRVHAALDEMLEHLQPGATEIDVWSHFHRHLIAHGGEYVSTRLVQAGDRTFPYFHEAQDHVIEPNELFCIDTDAIGVGGYAVDFSRTYHVGPDQPTTAQRQLHALALEQLRHNASLLAPGRTFAEFADRAWAVPERHAPFGYSCLAHGLGMTGEWPYVPAARSGHTARLDGCFEPDMVICIESYIGDPDLERGVKLEDQYLVTATGAEPMSTARWCPALMS